MTGNTVVIKPSSETPTIAAVFAETLLEAGFPAHSFCFLTGSGGAIGDLLVAHPKTRFISFTGSRDVGLHINELAAKPQKGQIWIKRVVAEMGGKDAIVVDGDCDSMRRWKALPCRHSAIRGRSARRVRGRLSMRRSMTGFWRS